MIQLEDVYKAFGSRQVLKGLSFRVEAGETYVLMGPSGIGKSTVIKHVIGLLEPDRGRVLVDGQNVPDLDDEALMALRRRMGYLFQSGALINWLTVHENVALPLRENGGIDEDDIEAVVREKLDWVGLGDAGHLLPTEISGGMRKRAAIARALATEPKILLYDEPTAGLDPIMSNNISLLIKSVQERFGVTSIVVTHHRGSAAMVGNRIGLITDGRILQEGTPEEMRDSSNQLVRTFFSGVDK